MSVTTAVKAHYASLHAPVLPSVKCRCGEWGDLKLQDGELVCSLCRRDWSYLEHLERRERLSFIEADELIRLRARRRAAA